MAEEKTNKKAVYDPYGLLGRISKSECCPGYEAKTISYWHTGEELARCQNCGREDYTSL